MTPLPTSTTLPLDAALAYLARGWRPIPVDPVSKSPCIVSWQKTYPDERTIRARWTRWPTAGVGLVLGWPTRLVALDVDVRSGGPRSLEALEQAHGKLPPTLTSRTPSGGLHLVFRLPRTADLDALSNAASKLAPGIDVRADRSQIIVAPSARPDGVYAWVDERRPAELPSWLLTLLPRRRSAALGTPTSHVPINTQDRIVRRARAYLAKCPPAISGQGGHAWTFLVAQHIVRGFRLDVHTALALLGEWNTTCQPPWTEHELIHKVIEARDRGRAVEWGAHLNAPR
jgi:hypothetical protein